MTDQQFGSVVHKEQNLNMFDPEGLVPVFEGAIKVTEDALSDMRENHSEPGPEAALDRINLTREYLVGMAEAFITNLERIDAWLEEMHKRMMEDFANDPESFSEKLREALEN